MAMLERLNRIVWLNQLISYLYVPYQLLQVVGYRLVGQRCKYEWGKSSVKPIEAMTTKQQLVGLLFPVLVFWLFLILGLILCAYIFLLYRFEMPWIIIPLVIFFTLPLSPYFYQVVFDMWRAYRLLKHSVRITLTE